MAPNVGLSEIRKLQVRILSDQGDSINLKGKRVYQRWVQRALHHFRCAPGTTTAIFRLEDSSSPEKAVQKALTITITLTPKPLVISTSSLPEGTVNQPYNPTTLQATGGIQPYTWSVNPALPNGLQLNVLSLGTITGTPLNGTGGTTTHTFTVADSDAPTNQTTTTQVSLKINPATTPVEITSPAGNFLPNARVGKKYRTTLNGSGGVPPYTWSITPALPTGLLLNTSTGEITGKPAKDTSGIYFLTIMVQDSSPADKSIDEQAGDLVRPPVRSVSQSTLSPRHM